MTVNRHIGVDIERVRPAVAAEAVAEQFFSPREIAALRALPPAQQIEAFFNCWTRKEAYVKATGQGLTPEFQKFAVSLAPGEPAVFQRIDSDLPDLDRWSIEVLDPALGYAAALVVEGGDWEVDRYDIDGVIE